MAQLAKEAGENSPAVSLAAHCAILAKDALCLAALGHTSGTTRHTAAISELRSTGLVSSGNIKQFALLIQNKNEAQYGHREISDAKTEALLSQAVRFLSAVTNAIDKRT